MYRVSPFTYLIEGLLGQGQYIIRSVNKILRRSCSAVGGQAVNCASNELVPINPPQGLTCSMYMERFISTAGGYVANADGTAECLYCPYRTTDEFMESIGMNYSHDWRDLGILGGVCVFNVCSILMQPSSRMVSEDDSSGVRDIHVHIHIPCPAGQDDQGMKINTISE